jgi:hypothetical protein
MPLSASAYASILISTLVLLPAAAHAGDAHGYEHPLAADVGRYENVPDYRVIGGDVQPLFDRSFDRYEGGFVPTAPASMIVGSGRVSGDANAWYSSGAGSYFTLTRVGATQDQVYDRHGRGVRSRILQVGPDAASSACSFEAGVCVIRGQ